LKPTFTRREFIAASTLTSGALAASAELNATTVVAPKNPDEGAWARWLDGRAPAIDSGITWGMPWPRGKHRPRARFALRTVTNESLPMQSWPIAYWPDGSLKWTAHAAQSSTAFGDGPFEVVPQREQPTHNTPMTVLDSAPQIVIDTGVIRASIPRQGSVLIDSIRRGEHEVLRQGHLVMLRQDRPMTDAESQTVQEAFTSTIEQVEIEQRGPIRAVVRITGKHTKDARSWLPFTLRLYFYANSDALRVLHTIIFDGDEQHDFIRGIGLRFDVPLTDPLHDRHVRFAGEERGVFAEAVRGLTGLRRDPGKAARDAQLAGERVPSISPVVADLLKWVPAFGDWTLLQSNCGSYVVRKRTSEQHSWLEAASGHRSAGLAYVGGPSGGVTCGIRNFWQSHPAQIDLRHAASASGQVTLWVWAPDAPPMDLRFYHDGLGQQTHEEQLAALEITYEDYEPGFGTPLGVARTSEMMLWLQASTPPRERFADLSQALSTPAVMVATPQTLHEAAVFGRTFTLPSRSSERVARIEDKLDWLFDFYLAQRDRHRWYGFWNYGDVMHTYDADRHVWRYDVGGFAWDNSELSTDIWLWFYFLRSGRADAFRFAEAMTRHTGEVDVHHLGPFAPLGSRHNVMHWGCSAKQLRISTALNRRYYYFLTADERVGDLMREQVEAARTLRRIEPGRKLADARLRERADPNGSRAWLGFGTDWGSIAGAWLAEWERTGDRKMRARLIASMRTIGAQPRGFFTSSGWMQLDTGAFEIASHDRVSVSHLSAAFGLPEVCAELIELVSVPEFERAWVEYCELYNAAPQLQQQRLGTSLGSLNLAQGHARLTAYASHRTRDVSLARRAWMEFDAGGAGFPATRLFETRAVAQPQVLEALDEAPWVSTNSAAQWGLAAIECLAFAAAGLDA
jgi:YetA-like protein